MDPEALIDLLADKGLCGDSAPQDLLSEFEASGKELFSFLEAAGLGGREEILNLVATEQGREFVDLDRISMPPALLSALDPDLLRIFQCLPLEVSDSVAKICIADPFDSVAVQDLASILGKKVEVAVADPEKIRAVLARLGDGIALAEDRPPVAASLGRGPENDSLNQGPQPVASPALLVALIVIALLSMAFAALYLNQNRRLDAWTALVEKNESLLRQSEASRKGVESAIIQMQSDLDALEKLLTKKEVDAIRIDVFEKDLSELRGRMESLGKILAEVESSELGGGEGVSPKENVP